MIRHKLLLTLAFGFTQAALTGSTILAQSPDDDVPAYGPYENGGDPRGDRGNRFGRSDRREDRGGDRSGGRSFGGFRGGREQGGPPGGPPAAGQPGAKPKVRVGRVGPKPPPPPKLPADYIARDTNRDGQIGMYEWSKNDLTTFARLDTNGDGFLIPAELVNPGSGNRSPAVSSTLVPTSSSPVARGPNPFAATALNTPTSTTKPSTTLSDPKVVEAESAFDGLDSNKDGALSTEEWERSRNARKRFADAKVEIQMPLLKAKFVENYVKLSK